MRRLFNKKLILTTMVTYTFDMLAYLIADSLGAKMWLSILISYIPSSFMTQPVDALISKGFVYNKVITAIAVIVYFIISTYVFWVKFESNILVEFPLILLLVGILPSVVSYIYHSIRLRKEEERVRKLFNKGSFGIIVEPEKADKVMEHLIGENKEIDGKYHKNNAVKCTNGIFVGRRDRHVLSFKGIPYAKQPDDKLRWLKTVKSKEDQGVYEAFYYGHSEPQPYNNMTTASRNIKGEDCLHLNVWAGTKGIENCPVLVWFNTIDWCTGGTASPFNDGDELVRKNQDIVFVNVDFRLGLFSNMDLSDTGCSEEYMDSYNLGIRDMIMSLRWIKENIRGFGGDPDNITIIGNGCGGTAVILLPVIEEAKGLFKRVVSLGGSYLQTISLNSLHRYRSEVSKILNVSTFSEYLKLDENKLGESVYELPHREGVFPVTDGKLIPVNILEEYETGKASDIEMLISVARNEAKYALLATGDLNKAKELYTPSLKSTFDHLNPEEVKCLKLYIEKYYPTLDLDDPASSEIFTEIFWHMPMAALCKAHRDSGGKNRYMIWDFESPAEDIGASNIIQKAFILGKTPNSGVYGVVGDPVESDAFQKMIVNFAKTGDPSLYYGEVENADEMKWPDSNAEDFYVLSANDFRYVKAEKSFEHKMEDLLPLSKAICEMLD